MFYDDVDRLDPRKDAGVSLEADQLVVEIFPRSHFGQIPRAKKIAHFRKSPNRRKCLHLEFLENPLGAIREFLHIFLALQMARFQRLELHGDGDESRAQARDHGIFRRHFLPRFFPRDALGGAYRHLRLMMRVPKLIFQGRALNDQLFDSKRK